MSNGVQEWRPGEEKMIPWDRSMTRVRLDYSGTEAGTDESGESAIVDSSIDASPRNRTEFAPAARRFFAPRSPALFAEPR